MLQSRLRRFEEHRQERKIIGSLVGIIAIFLFLVIFGVKILTAFSLLVDNIKNGSKKSTTTATQELVLPPELDPLPVATNSATIVITGKGTAGLTAILNINQLDTRDTKVGDDGSFKFTSVPLTEGMNSFTAKLATDDKKNVSTDSEALTISFIKSKPKLDLTSPDDGTKISGDQNTVTVAGKTDDTDTVTVNGRLVVIRNDGSFSYDFPLSEGDTTLSIIATDIAGNQTKIDRKVTYSK